MVFEEIRNSWNGSPSTGFFPCIRTRDLVADNLVSSMTHNRNVNRCVSGNSCVVRLLPPASLVITRESEVGGSSVTTIDNRLNYLLLLIAGSSTRVRGGCWMTALLSAECGFSVERELLHTATCSRTYWSRKCLSVCPHERVRRRLWPLSTLHVSCLPVSCSV